MGKGVAWERKGTEIPLHMINPNSNALNDLWAKSQQKAMSIAGCGAPPTSQIGKSMIRNMQMEATVGAISHLPDGQHQKVIATSVLWTRGNRYSCSLVVKDRFLYRL